MIDEQTQKISELINKSIMRCILSQDGVLWNQLISCLDMIGDAELAITAYLDRKFGESTGELYVVVYGLLQILIVQQDAVKYLCESLNVPEDIKRNPRLRKIRNIRIDTIGHPTKKDRDKSELPSCHFISRITLKYDGFQYMSVFSNGTSIIKDVSIPDLITDQKTCLSEILTSVISKLEQKEKAHKEMFRMEKLVSLFPANFGYSFEKVRGGTTAIENPRACSDVSLGAAGLLVITTALQDFKEALAKRGVDYDYINYVCRLLEYPLAELESFFQNAQGGRELNINKETAFIFAFFVEKQVGELIPMAKEIDEDYSS